MTDMVSTAPSLGLMFLLGLRHGLDPDHIAVIDNMTLRAVEGGRQWAAFTGTLFALGHSLSVAVVALAVAAFARNIAWPDGMAAALDWAVVGLLVLVGTLNLRALLKPESFVPLGWRQKLVPARLRNAKGPLAIISVGAMFGLVFDTATQAAAWGAAAAASGGMLGAGAIALAFAAGMILTDTADSVIVTRLLRGRTDGATLARYRRAVGWLIVILSFGMAAYTAVSLIDPAVTMADATATALGIAMVVAVALVAWNGRRSRAA